MEQTDLRTRRTPAPLAFADHMNRFIASDRTPRGPKRSEVLTRVDPSLDRAVVLFQDVIEVRHRPMLAAAKSYRTLPDCLRAGSAEENFLDSRSGFSEHFQSRLGKA